MSITIPAELLPADGRFGCGPSKVRPEALQALADRRRGGHGHLAPAGAGQGPGPADPRGPGAAVRPARRLRGRARQRRDDGVLGRRRVRAHPRPQRARHLRRVLREVRLRRGRGAVPRRPGDRQGRPGLAGPADGPRPASTPTRWAHNETSTGVMAPVARPRGRRRRRPGAHRRDQRRRRPAGRRRRRPTSTTSRRRSPSPPTAGCGSR